MRTGTALVLSALSLAACEQALPGGTRYELVTASETELPATLRVEAGCVHTLYGGTVEMDGQGGYAATYDIRIMCRDSTFRPDLGATGRFTVRNDTAFFVDSAGVNAGKGRITGDSLIVQGPLRRLVYLRR